MVGTGGVGLVGTGGVGFVGTGGGLVGTGGVAVGVGADPLFCRKRFQYILSSSLRRAMSSPIFSIFSSSLAAWGGVALCASLSAAAEDAAASLRADEAARAAFRAF